MVLKPLGDTFSLEEKKILDFIKKDLCNQKALVAFAIYLFL